jgi:hypothetical protein
LCFALCVSRFVSRALWVALCGSRLQPRHNEAKRKGLQPLKQFLNPLQRPRIHLSTKILLHRSNKLRPTPRLRKQRHRRTKLQIIRKPKYLARRSSLHPIHKCSALPQPGPKYRVRQIRPRLFQRPNRKPLRHRTPAQPSNLRKNKPHPMTPLLPRPQLLTHPCINQILRLQKPPQVVRITRPNHFESQIQSIFRFNPRFEHLVHKRRISAAGTTNLHPVAAIVSQIAGFSLNPINGHCVATSHPPTTTINAVRRNLTLESRSPPAISRSSPLPCDS